MKKLFFCALLAPVFSGLYAQQTEKTTFGVRAGINFQNLNGKDDNGNKLDNKLKAGFNLGVNAEVPIAPEFYFQPGLLFTTKGAKNNSTNPTIKTNLSYLEIPLNFLYKGALGKDKVLFGFGPYLGFGLGGKVKAGSQSTDVKFKSKAGTDLSVRYVKPIDAGANILFGYELSNNFSAQLNAQLGLANLNAYPGNAKVHNTGFGVSVGYRFNK
jgi:hypothetical protein